MVSSLTNSKQCSDPGNGIPENKIFIRFISPPASATIFSRIKSEPNTNGCSRIPNFESSNTHTPSTNLARTLKMELPIFKISYSLLIGVNSNLERYQFAFSFSRSELISSVLDNSSSLLAYFPIIPRSEGLRTRACSKEFFVF